MDEIGSWLDAFKRETGTPLAYLRLDMQWSANWKPQLAALAGLIRRKGVKLQVIYNGDGRSPSDKTWMASAVRNFQEFESVTKPDAVAIQFWTPHPSRLLPETSDTTATWLVNRYAEWRKLHQ